MIRNTKAEQLRCEQARNQLGTQGRVLSFMRGPNFLNYIQYLQCPTADKFFQGSLMALPPGYGPGCESPIFWCV